MNSLSAASCPERPAPNARLLAASAAFAVAYCAAALVQKLFTLNLTGAILVALLPVVAFFFFIREEVRVLRALDELQRRIQLEALAVAFPLAMMLLMFVGFLQRGGILLGEDFRSLWGLLPLCYFIGLVVARRRYL